MTVFHVWLILFPVFFEGFSVRVWVGSLAWVLSERTPPGFKDVNPVTKEVMMQGDDVWRICEMTFLLGVLMPFSYHWLKTKYHLGIHVHNLISVMYLIDIIRRHSHPHNW